MMARAEPFGSLTPRNSKRESASLNSDCHSSISRSLELKIPSIFRSAALSRYQREAKEQMEEIC